METTRVTPAARHGAVQVVTTAGLPTNPNTLEDALEQVCTATLAHLVVFLLTSMRGDECKKDGKSLLFKNFVKFLR